MKNVFKKIDAVKTGIFAAGVLFGTAGIKVLSSQDAKKVYTNCTAAVLRAKKCVMKTATTIQENAGDIYAEAKAINEEREAAEEAVDDTVELNEVSEETESTDLIKCGAICYAAAKQIANGPSILYNDGIDKK